MIYIIFGASGSGKTTLIHCVFMEYGELAVHVKGTTRARRGYDDIEIVHCEENELLEKYGGNNGYIYENYGHKYGIEKKQIDKALACDYPHFVICNDIETIKKIKKDYPGQNFVIYLRFDAPERVIRDIQEIRHITDDEINLRLSKIEYLNEQFIHNTELFDQVIINKYGDNPSTKLWGQMKRILDLNNERKIPSAAVIYETIDYLTDKITEYERKIIQSEKIDVIEPNFVFIIMPMGGTDSQSKLAINNVLNSIMASAVYSGFNAQRVDTVSVGNSTKSIDTKMYESIKKAEIIVADLTYERPNCYFELGYAMALGKDIIIIAREGTKLHFDAEHYTTIIFKDEIYLTSELKAEFSKRKNEKS